jgi:hypothetical protein
VNHDFDLVTEFCKACGAGALEVAEGKRPRDCEGGGNMVAISHVVRGRRLRQAFERSCAITIYRPGDPGYVPPPDWIGYDFTGDDGPSVA